METRAPFIIVGAFVLAAIGAIFGFVYWLHNASGLGTRTTYQVQFNGPVSGLLVGAAVLFNGIRVGEVAGLGLAVDNPRQVNVSIAVASGTPIRADTKVGLEFQGLTGVPVISLEGGKQLSSSGVVPTLIAESGAGQSMTEAAREVLKRVDSILVDNAEPLKSTIGNLKTFTEGLAKNTGSLDGIVAGLERMTGGGAAPAPKTIVDLRAAQNFPPPTKAIKGQMVIPEPTTIVMFDTQKIILPPGNDYSGFTEVQWSDSIPKLVQAKVIQSFENYDIAHPPLRAAEGRESDSQLVLDIRSFQIKTDAEPAAEIAFSAKIIAKNGQVIGSRLFQASAKLEKPDPTSAVSAFNSAFENIAKDLISWTAATL